MLHDKAHINKQSFVYTTEVNATLRYKHILF